MYCLHNIPIKPTPAGGSTTKPLKLLQNMTRISIANITSRRAECLQNSKPPETSRDQRYYERPLPKAIKPEIHDALIFSFLFSVTLSKQGGQTRGRLKNTFMKQPDFRDVLIMSGDPLRGFHHLNRTWVMCFTLLNPTYIVVGNYRII